MENKFYDRVYQLSFKQNKEIDLSNSQRNKLFEKLKELNMFTQAYRQILPTDEDEDYFMINALKSSEVKEELSKNYTFARKLENTSNEVDSLTGKMLINIMDSLQSNSNLIEHLLSSVENRQYTLLEDLKQSNLHIAAKEAMFYILLDMGNIRFLVDIAEPYFHKNNLSNFYTIIHLFMEQLIIDTKSIIDMIIDWERGC